MEPTDKELLQQTYQLERENNRMLRSMRRNAFFGGIFKLIIWAVFLLGPLWLYYTYAQQYVQPMINAYIQMQGFLPHPNTTQQTGSQSAAQTTPTAAMQAEMADLMNKYGPEIQKYFASKSSSN